MSAIGMRYRELPWGVKRNDINAVLSEFDAKKCSESGTPAFETNSEIFQIGKQRLRLLTEDEMFVSLWGRKTLVDSVYAKIIVRMEEREGRAIF